MKEAIKKYIFSLGADVCGTAAADNIKKAPEGFRPTDIQTDCKSIIVFGIALPKGVYMSQHRLIYSYFNSIVCPQLDKISLQAAKHIETEYGVTATPVPSDGPYDAWNAETLTGHGVLSMKHLAESAGLGRIAKSSLLLNEAYGNRLLFGAVLTSLELESDSPAADICNEGCNKCEKACPVGAISGKRVNQQLCRPNSYSVNDRGFDVVLCNKCRLACPHSLGK